MITKKQQGKIFCKGRGVNCPGCKDKHECVDSTVQNNKTYETMLQSGTKVRFEYEDKTYSLVGIYINDEYWGIPQGSRFIKQLLKDLENKKQERLDPMEIIEQLIKENKPFMITFSEEYKAYLEVLNAQVFEPNGYRLIAEKIEEV